MINILSLSIDNMTGIIQSLTQSVSKSDIALRGNHIAAINPDYMGISPG